MRSMTLGDSTKKPPLIQLPSPMGFFLEAGDLVAVRLERTEAAGGLVAVSVASLPWRGGSRPARGDVDIADAVAVGEAEGLFAFKVGATRLRRPPGHGFVAGVHQCDAPGLGVLLVHFHLVVGHVEGDIGHVQEVVGEVLLDHVALVAAADDEIVDAVAE
jgi:hypothetical protein